MSNLYQPQNPESALCRGVVLHFKIRRGFNRVLQKLSDRLKVKRWRKSKSHDWGRTIKFWKCSLELPTRDQNKEMVCMKRESQIWSLEISCKIRVFQASCLPSSEDEKKIKKQNKEPVKLDQIQGFLKVRSNKKLSSPDSVDCCKRVDLETPYWDFH